MVLMQGNVKWWGMIGCTYHGMSEGDSFGGAVRNAVVFECQDIWETTSGLGFSLSFIFCWNISLSKYGIVSYSIFHVILFALCSAQCGVPDLSTMSTHATTTAKVAHDHLVRLDYIFRYHGVHITRGNLC
jgi:hypothetical protein